MSFIKIHRKKDSPLLEQESNSIGEPAASVPDSNLFNKDAQNLGTMVKEKYSQYGDPSSGTRHANIVSVVTIACVGLFFVLFFTTDLPGKILSASAAQPATAVTSVSGDSQLDPEEETTSFPRIVVIPGANMTKEDLLTYVGDLPDVEAEMILKSFQTRSEDVKDNQVAGSPSPVTEGSTSATATPSVDPVASSTSEKTSAVDVAVEAERKSASQINGSKRLKLVQDLNSTDYLYYVAEDGDTMLALSKAFGVSLGQLLEVNGLNDADVIRAGQILLFPGDTQQPDLSGK
ncbi:LysM peptidoglycan-binding domain-containing protein [Paenibacillus sp. FSL H8-0104]|uniref:LysM peptidoglycan-binding domain-containing protein n=1 Tax=Paenibacillus sp. FSL H8-0104 TaxID=2954509 RepID=UPI0030FDD6BE